MTAGGIPLKTDGWFGLILFTDFSGRPLVGIQDWYTVAAGFFALAALAWFGAMLALAGLITGVRGRRTGGSLLPFLGSAAFLLGLLVATAVSIFPVMLRSVPDPALSITAFNGSNDAEGLRTALRWWVIGFPIAIGYFVLLFRLHRGKALAAWEGEGY